MQESTFDFSFFSVEQNDVLEKATSIASKLDVQLYLVGGCIRDALIKTELRDIDLSISSHVEEFLREISRKFSVDYIYHPQFESGEIPALDLSVNILRKETYLAPAILPQIEVSSLEEDLTRRDFSINAMALQLYPIKKNASIVDVHSGIYDIKHKNLRVLHLNSFRDDPTRIFRIIKFSERLSFKIDSQTRELMRKSIFENIPSLLSKTRVKNELFLIFKEKSALKIIDEINNTGILNCIFPGWTLKGEQISSFRESINISPFFEKYISVEKIYYLKLAIILSAIDLRKMQEALKAFSFSDKFIKMIKNFYKEKKKIIKKLKKIHLLSDIHELLLNFDADILFLLSSSVLKEEQEKILNHLDLRTKLKIVTDGRRLIEMGYPQAPVVSEILNALCVAKLEGKIENSAESEEQFIESHFPKL